MFGTSSIDKPLSRPTSPKPKFSPSLMQRKKLSFSFKIPLEVPLGVLKFNLYEQKLAFIVKRDLRRLGHNTSR